VVKKLKMSTLHKSS